MSSKEDTAASARARGADIETIDAAARRLYRRARSAGSDLSDVAVAVRGLHTVLTHLKVEAEDADSPLNADANSIYIRQLGPMVKDCASYLQQLDAVMGTYGVSGSDDEVPLEHVPIRLDGRGRDLIALVRNKLIRLKLHLDVFLDTVQLRSSSRAYRMIDTDNANLDGIKDRVDVIARRITQRRDSVSAEADEKLWLQFRDELVNDGFSTAVLSKNQDVLRAYIRQLDQQDATTTGGATPTMRGFLESYRPSADPRQLPPHIAYSESAKRGPRARATMDELTAPARESERRRSHGQTPYPPSPPARHSTVYSYPRQPPSNEEGGVDGGVLEDAMAPVMSTQELMALDSRDTDLLDRSMDRMHLQSASSAGRGPDRVVSRPWHPQRLGPSSRSSPPPGVSEQRQTHAQRYARLGPDSQGHQIPLDAPWTRIRRSLISTDLLLQEGVRFEARPDFVAILGIYTKDDIADFARRSVEARNRRLADGPRRGSREGQERYRPETVNYRDLGQPGSSKDDGSGRGGLDRAVSSSPSSSSAESGYSTASEPSEGPSRRARAQAEERPPSSKDDDGRRRRSRVYPFIVSPPHSRAAEGGQAQATAPTAVLKSILKKKDEDPHVRFALEADVPRDRSTAGLARREDEGGRDRDPDRDRYRDRDDAYRRDRPRRYSDGGGGGGGSGSGGGGSNRRDGDHERRGSEYRDRERQSAGRAASKRKSRTETLRALGIGGAAASLLSVLAEAAAEL